MYRMFHFPPFTSPRKLSGGTSFPWYPATALDSATPIMALGAFWELQADPGVAGGNAFLYVKADAALGAGELVSYALPAASTVTSSGSTTQSIITGGGGLTVNAEAGNFLYVRNTTTDGGGAVIKKILSNTATAVTISGKDPNSPAGNADVEALTLAATNADVTDIIRPWHVRQGTATAVPIGVTLGAVTSGNYTIIQVAGLTMVKGLGQTTAVLVAGTPAVPAAAGVITGSVSAAANLYLGGGLILPQSAVDSATAILIPAFVNFLANI